MRTLLNSFSTKYLKFLVYLNWMKIVDFNQIDKRLHFAVSFLLTLGLYFSFNTDYNESLNAWYLSTSIVNTLGWLKEIFDGAFDTDNIFDIDDIVANILGIIFTLPIIFI